MGNQSQGSFNHKKSDINNTVNFIHSSSGYSLHHLARPKMPTALSNNKSKTQMYGRHSLGTMEEM